MTPQEFVELDRRRMHVNHAQIDSATSLLDKPPILVSDLKNQVNRTLLRGYNDDQDTFHFYLRDGFFHVLWYKWPVTIISYAVVQELVRVRDWDLIPNEWLHPEACDYEFCEILTRQRYYLPFTDFDAKRPIADFYGFLAEMFSEYDPPIEIDEFLSNCHTDFHRHVAQKYLDDIILMSNL